MTDEIKFIAALPSDCSAVDRATFRDLVVQAGEVVGAALNTNVANARVLVMLKHHGIVRGVAALKRPQDSYRDKIINQAATALPRSEYPYELGYIFIEPDLQGRGLSHRLVAEALAHNDGAAVFATVRTDNGPMRSTLAKAGFTAVGRPYLGVQKQMIGLLVRQGGIRGWS